MKTLEILFFVLLFIVFYTYLGYGILLWILVKIKQIFHPAPNENADGASKTSGLSEALPEVTLFITAYNEEKVVDGKMKNCHELDYPKDKLKIVWVTDGSNDHTNDKLKEYADATVLFTPERKGKTAAMNRGMRFVTTPIVVFTDANTFINNQAIREIVNCFNNPKVGCVAGEKRVDMNSAAGAAAGGEGLYWKYESFLKKLDYQLYSAIGAAGELFAIRTSLYEEMPADTLLDDFILSLRITMKKYIIAYCDTAYALESGSADMKEEEKRKVRISAGGLQSIYRLSALLNPLRYGVLSFQYISHRVLRWSVTPVALFLLFPLNIILAIYSGNSLPYIILLLLQILFYIAGFYGYYLSTRSVKNKLLYIPYYFLFMNINVIKGFFYLKRHKGGAWEKARRA
ncbi:glycosyltransferase family 2 protein [Phocaeicola sp.]